MLQVLIGIIVIAIVVVCAMYFYQRNLLNRINKLRQQLTDLDNSTLITQLDDQELATFAGDTLKRFEGLQTKYHEEVVPSIAEAKAIDEEIAEEFHGAAVLSLGSRVDDLATAVNKASSVATEIAADLKNLDHEIEQQDEAADQLRSWLRKEHNTLTTDAAQYGDSVAKLNEKLTTIEHDFATFAQLTKQGDRDAAASKLADLQAATAHFDDLMAKIPVLSHPLLMEFPDQLAELKQGYGHLISDNYHFTEDNIDHAVEALEQQRQVTLNQLAVLDLSNVDQINADLAQKIDHLYAVMEKEITARPKVQQMLVPFADHLAHAQQQNKLLTNELDRLNISYTLNNDEIATVRQLDEQLKQIEADFNTEQKRLEAQTAVDSEVLANLWAGEKAMTAIEQQQTEINANVSELQSDEKLAREALQRYAVDLRTTKRRVEGLNLPGLPLDYLDFFFLVSDELSQLSKDMNKQQIDMDAITKKMLVVQDDFDKLHDKTNSLRDSAALTERLLQYAQRLSMQHPALNEMIARTQTYFNEYEYARALEIIGSAVEDVEPGVYKQIEDSYYREIGRQ